MTKSPSAAIYFITSSFFDNIRTDKNGINNHLRPHRRGAYNRILLPTGNQDLGDKVNKGFFPGDARPPLRGPSCMDDIRLPDRLPPHRPHQRNIAYSLAYNAGA